MRPSAVVKNHTLAEYIKNSPKSGMVNNQMINDRKHGRLIKAYLGIGKPKLTRKQKLQIKTLRAAWEYEEPYPIDEEEADL